MPSSPPTIVFLDDYQDLARHAEPVQRLKGRCNVRFHTKHAETEKQLLEYLEGAEIVCGMRERTPFPASLLEKLPSLKLLLTSGPANASYDMEAAARLGITVCGTPMPPSPPGTISGSNSTTEITWALILALTRHLPTEVANVREGRWQTTVGTTLASRTIGLFGLGKLGQQTALVAKAFGMKVIAWSANLTAEKAAEVGVEYVDSLDELCRQAEFLSVHQKLSDRTHKIVGRRQLELLGPEGYLINTSRGPIVDEEALVDALKKRKILAAGLDVFDIEPLPADHPLRTLPNVICTPHIGYGVKEAYEVFFRGYIEAIEAFLDGRIVGELTKDISKRR